VGLIRECTAVCRAGRHPAELMVAACLLLLVCNPICSVITRQTVRGRIREQIQRYDIDIYVYIYMCVYIYTYIYIYVLLNLLLCFISS
jgi:hypothetical protein